MYMKRRISNPEDHRGNWAYNNDMSKYLGKRQEDKPKPKKYPLDEYIEQIWYDDWLKKQEAKGVVIDDKHYWKIGGSI